MFISTSQVLLSRIALFGLLNKATGLRLFLLPFTFLIVDVKNSAVVACVFATVAVVWECRWVIRISELRKKSGD